MVQKIERAYFDKEAKLWKVGKEGQPKWLSKEACNEEILLIFADRLKNLKDKLESVK